MKLTFTNVKKEYLLQAALSGVSFDASSGDVLCLLGPNGAGKTTLIRLAAKLTKPSGGEVTVDGTPLGRLASFSPGLITQKSYLYSDLTIEENLKLYAALYRSTEGWQKWADYFNLGENLGKKIGELSHGQKQRAALARVMLGNPELLLLDEPFLGLDAEATDELIRLVIKLKDEGKLILVATHQFEVATAIASMVMILKRGQIVHLDDYKDEDLHELYRNSISCHPCESRDPMISNGSPPSRG